MPIIYGEKAKYEIPESYDQTTRLKIVFNGDDIAWGYYTNEYFHLQINSLIMRYDDIKPRIQKLRNEWLASKIVDEQSEIWQDLYFYNPSIAGELILGRTCDGYVDWKNDEGVKLGHLLWPDMIEYF